MHVNCYLRELRERMPRKPDRSRVSLRDIERVAGVPASALSAIERGVMLPPDHQIDALEKAYGAPVTDWYDPRTLLVLQLDGDDL